MMLIHKCICAKIVHSLGSFLRGAGLPPLLIEADGEGEGSSLPYSPIKDLPALPPSPVYFFNSSCPRRDIFKGEEALVALRERKQ